MTPDPKKPAKPKSGRAALRAYFRQPDPEHLDKTRLRVWFDELAKTHPQAVRTAVLNLLVGRPKT